MITSLKINTKDNLWAEKRLVYLHDRPRTAYEEKHGEEEKVEPKSSQKLLLDKIEQVLLIKDPDEFGREFADFLSGEKIIDQNGEIDETCRKAVLLKIVKRVVSLSSEKSRKAINELLMRKLPMKKKEGENESHDVVQTAVDILENLSKKKKKEKEVSAEESELYSHLADTVRSLGLKHSDLEKTRSLTERKTLLDRKLKLAQTKVAFLSEYQEGVEKMEKEMNAKRGTLSKLITRTLDRVIGSAVSIAPAAGIGYTAFKHGIFAELGVRIGTFSAAVQSAPIAALLAISHTPLTGVVGAMVLSPLVGYAAYKGLIVPVVNRVFRTAERKSLDLQKQLLSTGSIQLKEGQKLVKFKTPVEMRLRPESKVDGQVLMEFKTVPAGSVIEYGVVAKTREFSIGEPIAALKAEEKKAEGSLELVNQEYQQHQGRISKRKEAFRGDLSHIEKVVENNKKGVALATAHLASLQLRKEFPKEEEKEIQDINFKREYDKAEKALEAARDALKNSEEALKAMKQVDQAFAVDEQYARKPVSKGMLKALYEQSLNPQLFDLVARYAETQHEAVKKAQEVVEKFNKKRIQESVNILGEAAKDEIRRFLDQQESFASMEEHVFHREFPAIKRLRDEKSTKDFYQFLASLALLPHDSKYRGERDYESRMNMLREVLEEEVQAEAPAEVTASKPAPVARAAEPARAKTQKKAKAAPAAEAAASASPPPVPQDTPSAQKSASSPAVEKAPKSAAKEGPAKEWRSKTTRGFLKEHKKKGPAAVAPPTPQAAPSALASKSISAEDAKKYLNPIPEPTEEEKKRKEPDKQFRVNKGPILASLEDLSLALNNTLNDEQFKFHTTERGVNDFEEWVRGRVGDTELADKIRDAKSRPDMIKAVDERVNELKKIAAKAPAAGAVTQTTS